MASCRPCRLFVYLYVLLSFVALLSTTTSAELVEDSSESASLIIDLISSAEQMKKRVKQADAVALDNWKKLQRRSEKWFLNLECPVVELLQSDLGIKGVKKLTEALKLGETLYIYAVNKERRKVVMEHIHVLAAQVRSTEYHQAMLTCSDNIFDQNSMSYMSVLRVLDNLRLKEYTVPYRELMKKVMPRMTKRLIHRGPWQRVIFADFYDQNHFPRPRILSPEALADQDESSLVIPNRLPASYLAKNLMKTYGLTHEIFAEYQYGYVEIENVYNDEDLSYLNAILPELVTHYSQVRLYTLVTSFPQPTNTNSKKHLKKLY